MNENLELNMEHCFTDEKMLKELAESDRCLNISLTNDFAFKTTFRNKKAMKGLLSALLEIEAEEIKDLEFKDTYLHGEFPEDKEGILDVKVLLNGNQRINIEIQVLPFLNWEERSLYYLSKHFIEDFGKGEDYGRLDTTVHISILAFNLNEKFGLYSIFELRERNTHRQYSDKIGVRVLQLKKMADASMEERKLDIYQWASIISAKDWEVLKRMAENNEYMKAAVSEMEKINMEKEKRYMYLQREKRIRDEAAIRAYGLKEGREAGRELGRGEGQEQMITVIQMLKQGKSLEEISAFTKCTPEMIEKVRREIM